MTETIVQAAQPYITAIVTAIIGVLASMVIVGLKTMQSKANQWLDARTTAAQRETIHKVACEAFALAQTAFKELGGQAKLEEALNYALKQLGKQGISVSAQEVQAAIEQAYLDYKAKVNK
ncbi:phage holin [Paenibacillus campi]|uniref:phage holin n=1 Tax=Paenibacillus campi TaxID=3106031 RepID=UPI002AFF8EA0|nr:phage holin [Paenibacillus sp. SGZ-1014]